MKKNKILSLMAVACTLGFVACNNSSDNTGTNDSTATRTDSSTTSTTTVTSNNNYAARADSFRVNSKAGYYLNPRTGKSYNISMDTTSGAITDESGHPVRRYVDKRTWWVYDATSGDTVGTARMNGGSLRYRDMNNNWVDYNKRWSDDTTSMDNGNNMSSDTSNGNMAPNSKVKIKTPEGKVKATDKGVKVRPKGE